MVYLVATGLVTETFSCLFNISASQYMQCSLIKSMVRATSVQVLGAFAISPFTSLTFRPILLYFLPIAFFFVSIVNDGKDTAISSAMVQAISSGPVTTKSWIRSRAIQCKNGGRSGTATCRWPITSVFP